MKKTIGIALTGAMILVSMTACTKPNAPTNENFIKAIKSEMTQHPTRYGIYFSTAQEGWGGPVSTNKVLYDNKIYVKTPETKRVMFFVNVPNKDYQAQIKRYQWLIQGGSQRWQNFSPNPPYPPVGLLLNFSNPIKPTPQISVPKWKVVHKYVINMKNQYLAGKTTCGPDIKLPDMLSPTGYKTFCKIPLGHYVFDKIISSTQPAASMDGRVLTHIEVLMKPSYNEFEQKVEPVSYQIPLKFKMVLVQDTNGWNVIESKKVPLF